MNGVVQSLLKKNNNNNYYYYYYNNKYNNNIGTTSWSPNPLWVQDAIRSEQM